MTYRIKIKDHINIVHSANEALLRRMESSVDQSISLERELIVMSNAWREHYGVDIVCDEYEQPKYFDFRDKKHFMLFVLRWS